MSTIIGTTRIEETVGWDIKQDIYGLDVLTRKYTGPASDWLRWRSTFPDEVADATFKDYFLVSRDAGTQRGGIINPTLTFKGVPGLSTGRFNATRPQSKKALVTKTVTLRLSDNSGRTIECEYKAPSTTFTYATGSEPTAQRFKGRMLDFDENFLIFKTRGATQFPISFLTKPVVRRVLVPTYFCYTAIYTEEFSADQAGRAWQVTERNDGVIYGVEQINAGTGGRPVVPRGVAL